MNELQKIYELMPDEPYYFDGLLENRAMTLDFIMKHPALLEHVKNYQYNPNAGLDYLDEFPDHEINPTFGERLSRMITYEEACANPVKYKFYFKHTSNPQITFEMIKNNPQHPWCVDGYALNPNATFEQLIEFGIKDLHNYEYNINFTISVLLNNPNIPWDFHIVSTVRLISLDDIDNNPDLGWDWKSVFRREDITIEFAKKHHTKVKYINFSITPNLITLDDIENNLDLNWHWGMVSLHRDINIAFIRRHLDKELSWSSISMSPNITMNIIRNNPDLPWNYGYISSNPNITIEFILENMDKRFNWSALSTNNSITIEMVKNNPNLRWNPFFLSANRNLTAEYMEEYKHEFWDFDKISTNSFNVEKKEFITVPM
jgi:hypothetical protein